MKAAMSSPAGSAPQTLTVAVLAGGRSSEHEVSLSSGTAVRAGLLACGHEVLSVEIGPDGAWRRDGERLSVTPGDGLLGVDVVFPALHGPFGEDGTVQGMLETLDVAYVGAGVTASAVSMNKVLSKELMSVSGVPQVDYVPVTEDRFRSSGEEVLEEIARLGLPVFVKPAHLGSSVGIVKVTEAERVASLPGEIIFPGDWYDFGAKYTAGGMELRVPARISPEASGLVQALALETFTRAGCEGLARVDFFVDAERVVVNELNTMPGFTPTSVYAKLMHASGIAYPQLVDRLCRLALERQRRRRSHRY